ncbi:hypothetical protein F0U60_52500 [Archangium minus]|uniref:Uncharacterized protein n=1 Tax=Archangium minus TaxID=83450 RepID=A0ABY9X8Q6_9BACT|nr:hypothetical protein F0U60_52500 [Archangium minus]
MLESAKLLGEGDLFPRFIEPDCFQALGIVWKLAVLEPRASLPLLVGLVDVSVGLRRASLESLLDEIQLRAGQGPLKGVETLGGLGDLDGLVEDLTGASRRRSEELPGACIDGGGTGGTTRLVELGP